MPLAAATLKGGPPSAIDLARPSGRRCCKALLRARDGWGRVAAVAAYAAAMGYAGAAAVIYLRVLHGGVDPVARGPTPPIQWLLAAEVGREAATIVMLAAVAALAGRGWAGRWGVFLLAFGLWDVTYYGFLALLAGWPETPLDWDVLFLIPLPWWGPVLAPAAIAAAMALSGALLLLREAVGDLPRLDRRAVVAGLAGAAVCLGVFMADAVASLLSGQPGVRPSAATPFNWPLFLVGYAALAYGFVGSALAPGGPGGDGARVAASPRAGGEARGAAAERDAAAPG